LGIAAEVKGEVCSLDSTTKAINRLQNVCYELAEFDVELKESDIEASALRIIRDSVDQIRMAAMTLQAGLKWFRVSRDKQSLLALLIEERMRRASQVNTDISKDFEAGRVSTDNPALSAYLLILNQVMDQLDLMFGSRKAKA
jgi:hypothetical protein